MAFSCFYYTSFLGGKTLPEMFNNPMQLKSKSGLCIKMTTEKKQISFFQGKIMDFATNFLSAFAFM